MTAAKRWYVVQVYNGFESQVKESLVDRMNLLKMEDKFGEILVPTEDVIEMRSGRRQKTTRKFYPGYVLIKMEMNDQTWHLVKDTQRVIKFIGGSPERPAPLTDSEALDTMKRIQLGVEKPRPKVLFEPGEMVRITEGPFADFNGVVEEVNYEKNRLRVAVSILGRSTPVELEFSQVQKA
jgi:transcriptional antiterminator NusG